MSASRRHGLGISLVVLAVVLAGPAGAQAPTSIVADTAPGLATGTNVGRSGAVLTIDGGARAGGNLFHSFRDFSLGAGETARWTASDPAGVASVINRVTGGGLSTIAGTIDSTALPNASFYFINPAGILFTQGARLNVPGAAYFSTAAGGLRFADGARFAAVAPGGSTLSMAAPESFGFLGGEGSISVVGVGQEFITFNNPLSLTAAHVGVRAGQLFMRSLDVVATGGQARSVSLSDPLAGAAFTGDVRLDNSQIFVGATGDNVQSIRIGAGRFTQVGGLLLSTSFFAGDAGDLVLKVKDADITGAVSSDTGPTTVDGDAGDVTISADRLRVGGGSLITSSTYGRGDAGNVTITAADILVEDNALVASDAVGEASTGRSGSVRIDAGNLTVRNLAGISSSTGGAGDAGSVRVKADALLLDGGFISSVAQSGSGDGGVVLVEARLLDIRNKGGITSFSASGGDAGTVEVRADKVSLSTNGSIDSVSFATGASGDVSISAGAVAVNQAFVSTAAFGSGQGGDISIVAPQLTVENTGSITSDTTGRGDAGDVTIAATRLTVSGNSVISSSTKGAGAGGRISISAETALVTFSEVRSQANVGSTGPAGTVALKIDRLALEDQSVISSTTFGAGDGGLVSAVSRDIALDSSGIVSRAFLGGDAGQVLIQTGALNLKGSGISSSTNGAGDAGGVTIKAERVQLTNASTIQSGAAGGSRGNGGTVDIATDDLDLRAESSIVTTTLSSGNAGKVAISAGQASLDDYSLISSRATDLSVGSAGSIALKAASLQLMAGSQIQTSSLNPNPAGSIDIASEGAVSVAGTDTSVSSENLSTRGGAAGSIVIRGGPIRLADGGFISTNSVAGRAGDISLLLPADRNLVLEGREDALGVITTSSGPGTGGRIVIANPLAIISNGGRILALGQARGANVQIQSGFFIRSSDRPNELSVDGVLAIDSQVGDISSGVEAPDITFLDASGVLRGQCASARSQGMTSQLVMQPVGPYAAEPAMATKRPLCQ